MGRKLRCVLQAMAERLQNEAVLASEAVHLSPIPYMEFEIPADRDKEQAGSATEQSLKQGELEEAGLVWDQLGGCVEGGRARSTSCAASAIYGDDVGNGQRHWSVFVRPDSDAATLTANRDTMLSESEAQHLVAKAETYA